MEWEVQTEEQYQRLRNYETSAYTLCFYDIDLAGGGRVEYVRTIRWARDPDYRELEEGAFEFVPWQTYFKPSIVGISVAKD